MSRRPLSVCEFCQKHIVQSPGIQWGRHHDDIKSIRDNDSARCVFCSRLYAESLFDTKDKTVSIPQYIWNFRRPIYARNQKQTYTISFRPVLDAGSDPKDGQASSDSSPQMVESVEDIGFILFRPEDFGGIENGQTGLSTDCDQVWQLADSWMNECINNHPACVSHRDDSLQGRDFMPSRLVKVLPANSSTNETIRVRVVDTALEHINAPYMTLSHCWGPNGSVQSQLLHSTKALYMGAGVPISAFLNEKTFQGAIRACIRLRIEYIWIDSLCICQDDKKDWEKEAALMHKVYRYSHCNIAAADSKVPMEGVFRTRSTHALTFPTCLADPPTKLLGRKRWCIVSKDFWDTELLKSHLYSRAWVFQERMLAPRILHFARDQVFWTCPSRNACETFPRGIPKFLINDAIFNEDGWRARLRESTNLSYGPRPGGTNMVSLDTFWRYAVDWYSRCNLTFAKDKLVALSGIAKLVGEALGEKQINGLWQNKFVEQLAWRVVRGQKGNGKPSARYKWDPKFCIPSWSWASMDGVIELVNRNIDSRDVVVTTHSGQDLVTIFETPQETRKRQSSTPAVSPEILQDGFNRFDTLISRHNSQTSTPDPESSTRPPLSRFSTPPARSLGATPYNAGKGSAQVYTQPIPISSEIGRATLRGTSRPWKWSFDLPGDFNVFPDVEPGGSLRDRECFFTILAWSEMGGNDDDDDEDDDYGEDEDQDFGIPEEEIETENPDPDKAADIHRADTINHQLQGGLNIQFKAEPQLTPEPIPSNDSPPTAVSGLLATVTVAEEDVDPLTQSPTAFSEPELDENTDHDHAHDPISPISPINRIPERTLSPAPSSSSAATTSYITGIGLLLSLEPASIPLPSSPSSPSFPSSSTTPPQLNFSRTGTFTFTLSTAQIPALQSHLIIDPTFCDGVLGEGGEWNLRWWLV